MKRTQINLTEDQWEYLKDKADRMGLSVGSVVRVVVQSHIDSQKKLGDLVRGSISALAEASEENPEFLEMFKKVVEDAEKDADCEAE